MSSTSEKMSAHDSDTSGAQKGTASHHLKYDGSDPEKGVGDIRAGESDAPITNVLSGVGGEDFRTMSKWDTLFALVTNQLGLGVLSLPATFLTLGIVPGIIAMIGLGIVTYLTGLQLHQFFCRYSSVTNVAEMAGIVGGTPFEILVGVLLLILLIFTCASASVTLSIAFNTISEHSVCTVGFIGIACLACWVLCLPRTIKFVAHCGVPCFISIFVAAMIVMISIGVDSPKGVPEGWKVDVKVVGNPTFRETFNACLRIVYAYAGNFAFVSYMAEMKNPVRDFPFALRGLIIVSISLYLLIAITIYCLAGSYVTSPTLGSAPVIPAKIAYGIIIPAVLTTGLSCGHIGTKYVHIKVMQWIKATDQITANTAKSWTCWTVSLTVFWIICFLLSNAIPVFDSIVSISSATCFSWMTYGFPAIFWFYLNRGRYTESPRKMILSGLNVLLICFALFLNGAGMWASITELVDLFQDENSTLRGPFSCGDNSIF